MYNRYIPQPDGSYRRSSAEPKPKPRKDPEPACPPPEPPRKDFPRQEPQHHEPPNAGNLGFLRQLLPKNMDSADLIVVLLLILMAGDCPEERSNALLTLALYFIM